MTEKTVQAVDRADEVKAQADAQASKQTQAIEKAWETLLRAGVVTEDDRKALERRSRDRRLLALAVDTLARAKAESDDVVSVSITTSTLVYAAEDGQSPRVFPRVTTPTRRQRKASETNSKASDNQASKVSGAEDIPDHILRAASDALGLKWFGPSNARRSGKVLEKARELMGQGQA